MNRLSELVLLAKSLRSSNARQRLILERARRAAKNPGEVHKLELPGFSHPIWLRAGGADYSIFLQVFWDLQYEHGLPINPALIVDAGANIGMSALFFARQYPRARILSIEPNEVNFQLLQKNTAGYPNVQCLRGALWPVESTVGISNETDCKNPSSYQVGELSDGHGTAVPCFTPLSLLRLAQAEAIDIFKIDIEGSELELFSRGSETWLGKVRVILAELHDSTRPGCGQAFFRSVCTQNFEFHQRSETSIVRFVDH
jgi:FkbM family methyltransferase